MQGGRRWHQVTGEEGLHLRSECKGKERRGVKQPSEGRTCQERSWDACKDSDLGRMGERKLRICLRIF